ncbi:MAG: YfhO family protein [Subdoligranulum sp.]|nr:YfhO family protein [Subdoligranulum sp.]
MSRLARPKPQPTRSGAVLSFALCAAAAFFIFLPFLVVDRGLFQYCGDFNGQQIPFYTYMNGFVKHSAGQWSWETDLGSSAVNSYAFYLCGSPFFWLTTLLPGAWAPYSMVPMFLIKFGTAGLGAYWYLRRYASADHWAVIGACLYTLSGFTVYNTFFNHFVDCIALFPFLLCALDMTVYDDVRGLFPLAVAVNLLNNYFFFAGQIVFLFLYFFLKVFAGEYRVTAKRFGRLAFESLLGVAMGCALLWPAVLCLKDNPRTVDLSSGFGFLMYGRVQQYFAIFASLFLPPDPTYLPNIFTDAVIKHTSMTAFLPVVSCAGVWAYMKAKPKTAFSKILWACLVMALVPVLNSSFYALNSSYYARWYYMPILMMCAATMRAVQDEQIDLMEGVRPVAVITALFAVFALVPKREDDVWSIGVVQRQSQFWLTYLTAVLGLLLFYGALRVRREKEGKNFPRVLLACILGFSVFYSVVHIALGKFPQWEGDAAYRAQCTVAAREADLPDDHFYRLDAYGCYDNIGLWMEKPVLQCFNSVVTPSIMDFYPRVGVKRDVSSKPEPRLYALRGLLSVEYVMMPSDKMESFAGEDGVAGYLYDHEDDTFAYYRNPDYVPMGFAYDKYILLEEEPEEETADEAPAEGGAQTANRANGETQPGGGAQGADGGAQANGVLTETEKSVTLMELNESYRSNMLMRAIALTEDQIERYGAWLEPVAREDTFGLTYDAYTQDAAARREMACDAFEADGTGFTAHITLESENLVFFSVPYDEGFSATVNGEPAPVERVNGGLCAVPCGAGENTIVFTYQTPGLRLSAAISLAALLVWAVYCGWNRRKKFIIHNS